MSKDKKNANFTRKEEEWDAEMSISLPNAIPYSW